MKGRIGVAAISGLAARLKRHKNSVNFDNHRDAAWSDGHFKDYHDYPQGAL